MASTRRLQGDPMKVNRGDIVFNNTGMPAVVMDRNEITGELKVQAKGDTFEQTRKHGFINGLSPEDRSTFYNIIDSIKTLENPAKQVAEYTKQIDTLKDDPKNRFLVRYLTAEKAHLMFSENIEAAEYSMWESKV